MEDSEKYLERLVIVETDLKALKSTVETFMFKIENKIDEVIKEARDRPFCAENRARCERRFEELERKCDAVNDNKISNTSAIIFSLLLSLLSILGTLLAVKL